MNLLNTLYISIIHKSQFLKLFLADREGFEPSEPPIKRFNDLAGRRLKPTQPPIHLIYFIAKIFIYEHVIRKRVGFSLTVK